MSVERDPVILMQKILDSIEKGLDVFGKSVKAAIYWGLEHEYHMKREEVATNPEPFCHHMKQIFGAGSELVELRIVNELRKQFSADDLDGHDLTKAINLIRREFNRR